jgi:hypothetical protein
MHHGVGDEIGFTKLITALNHGLSPINYEKFLPALASEFEL